MCTGAVGLLTLLVLARLELRRLVREARAEFRDGRDVLGPNDVALELLERVRQ